MLDENSSGYWYGRQRASDEIKNQIRETGKIEIPNWKGLVKIGKTSDGRIAAVSALGFWDWLGEPGDSGEVNFYMGARLRIALELDDTEA